MTYPIYDYVYFEDRPTESPLLWVMYDELFHSAVQLMVSAFEERMRHEPWGTATSKHYSNTITLLNRRLSSHGREFLSDTTIWSVNILASVAIWRSHHGEASSHTSALRQIVNVGGGKSFLSLRPTLRYHLFWYT